MDPTSPKSLNPQEQLQTPPEHWDFRPSWIFPVKPLAEILARCFNLDIPAVPFQLKLHRTTLNSIFHPLSLQGSSPAPRAFFHQDSLNLEWEHWNLSPSSSFMNSHPSPNPGDTRSAQFPFPWHSSDRNVAAPWAAPGAGKIHQNQNPRAAPGQDWRQKPGAVGTGFGRAEPWEHLQPLPRGISLAAAMENHPQRGPVTTQHQPEEEGAAPGAGRKHPCKFPVCWLRTGFSYLIMDEKIRDNGWIYKQHFVMWGSH